VLTVRLGTIKFKWWEIGFFALLFCLSAWIMWHTFSYDAENSTILIGSMMWSDMGANLPLIRSFSMGDNWPPEYPIYPCLPIQYHYLFFLIVGKLEAIGVPLNWAMNVPSILGFFLLLVMIYLLAKKWFGDARIAVLSVAFFLLNGSMGFLQFFQKFPLSWHTPSDILSNLRFWAMGPWDGGSVLAVWNLLVFVNQRHFSIALGILLSFIYVCLSLEGKSRKIQLYWAVLFGVLIGMFPTFHKAVLLIFAIVMTVYFLLIPYARLFLFATGAVSIAVMCLLYLLSFNIFGAPTGFGWYPGFMIHDSLSLLNALEFFWYQFGLHALLIPVGYCLAPRRIKIIVLPALIVFAFAFLFRFSEKDALVGHKFFNFFLIMGQILTAYVIVRAYDFSSARFPRTRPFALCVAAVLVFFLTLSGVIDLVPVVNMERHRISDIAANPEARWFAENTPRDSVIATSQFLYSPASIAGRKIFLGYAYFIDGAGYDARARSMILAAIFSGKDREGICRLLRLNNIGYVEVEEFEQDKSRPVVNAEYFKTNFSPEYVSKSGRYAVYATQELCRR